ncbi:hypothetical protein AB3S75_023702 [Citrus x aurantiifolia]
MTTNKERIERIEADLGSLQDRMEQMEVGINDKLQRLEETINKLVESNNATKGTTSRNSTENSSSTKPAREERDAWRHMPPTRITKLEFPRFAGDDPTEWYSRVSQYFEYQETDASGEGIGAVLQQQGRPIAYMSHALGTSKKGWSIYNKEMLAIVEAVRRWRPYLLGHRFIIKTDQRSIKFFLEQQVATPEQHKWMSKLMGYDYEIVYRPGRENKAADALSRRSDSPLLYLLFVPQIAIWDEIKEATSSDEYMQKILTVAQNQTPGPYTVRNGLLFFKERVVVPRTLRESLLYEAHDTKIGGHSGVLRTYKRLSQQFYWPAMFQAVREYVSKCKVCQQVKFDTLKPAGLLQPLPIPCQVWDDISLDFVEGLPSSQGKDTILVVVDRLSKFAHFISLTHPFSAKIVAEKFVEHVVKLHGMPKSIISDRDPIFISKFW